MAADSIFMLFRVRRARMFSLAPTHPCRPGIVNAGLCSATRRIVSLARSLIAADAGVRRWIYSSTLAHGVDANTERPLTAGATTSCCRACRFVAVGAAVALQLRRGGTRPLAHSRAPRGGWTVRGTGAVHAVGGADALACLMVLLTFEKCALWREREEEEYEGRGRVNKSARWGKGIFSSTALCM